MRILLADDDPAVRDSMSLLLQLDGHAVSLADGGAAAIEMFRSTQTGGEPVGIVITDLAMPGVDGYAVAAAVRSMSPRTPVILLTGWGQTPSDDPAQMRLVDEILAKPPKLAELREAMQRCARRAAPS